MTNTLTVPVWHIVRTSDGHYAETIRGPLENAQLAADTYRPNGRDLVPAHVVPCEPDYPATVDARRISDAHADYIQRHAAELLAKGIDTRGQSLGEALTGNDGE